MCRLARGPVIEHRNAQRAVSFSRDELAPDPRDELGLDKRIASQHTVNQANGIGLEQKGAGSARPHEAGYSAMSAFRLAINWASRSIDLSILSISVSP